MRKPQKPKAKPKPKTDTKPKTIKDIADRFSKNLQERSTTVQKYVNKIAVVTEVGRLVRDTEPNPVVREALYWKLIECLDYSDNWSAVAAKTRMNELYSLLVSDKWRDTPKEEEEESGGERPQEVL